MKMALAMTGAKLLNLLLVTLLIGQLCRAVTAICYVGDRNALLQFKAGNQIAYTQPSHCNCTSPVCSENLSCCVNFYMSSCEHMHVARSPFVRRLEMPLLCLACYLNACEDVNLKWAYNQCMARIVRSLCYLNVCEDMNLNCDDMNLKVSFKEHAHPMPAWALDSEN